MKQPHCLISLETDGKVFKARCQFGRWNAEKGMAEMFAFDGAEYDNPKDAMAAGLIAIGHLVADSKWEFGPIGDFMDPPVETKQL